MNEHLTADQLTARTESAVATAAAAARDLGLDVTDATALYDAFSVVVHLKPSPAVARMPIVLPPQFTPASQLVRQQAELDVAAWLLQEGHPVVPPSPLVRRTGVAVAGQQRRTKRGWLLSRDSPTCSRRTTSNGLCRSGSCSSRSSDRARVGSASSLTLRCSRSTATHRRTT